MKLRDVSLTALVWKEATHEADVEPQVPGRRVRISEEVPELLEAQLILHGLKTRGKCYHL